MPTRARLRALLAQRLGGYQSVTVSLPPDTTESAAQRLVLSTDLFDVDRPASSWGDSWAWVGRYGDGRRIKRSSYRSTSYAYLVAPTSALGADEAFSLIFYGFGETSDITLSGTASVRAAQIETEITSIVGLESYTVSAITTTTFKITMSSAVSVEISNANGSVTCGIGSVEATRPFRYGLPLGTTVELHSKLPAHSADGFTGLNDLLNQALSRLSFVDRLIFTADDDETTVFEITEPWLLNRSQAIRAYGPTDRSYSATFTPPGSGSYTLTIDVGLATDAELTLAYSASASALQTALNDALEAVGHQTEATVTGSGSFAITIPNTRYATPSITASSGTISAATTDRTETAYRFDGWRFVFDGERRYIELDVAFAAGESWELEVYRPCSTWICQQEDYETTGSTWASSTVGLQADLDQCAGDEDAIVAIAHYLACRQLATQGPAADVLYWQSEAARAASIAAQIKLFDTQRSLDRAPRDGLLAWERGRSSKGFFA